MSTERPEQRVEAEPEAPGAASGRSGVLDGVRVNPRGQPMRWAGGTILLALSCFWLVVGSVDSLTATSLIPRFFGAALVLAAFALFAGIYGLICGRESLTLLTCGLGAFLGSLMLVVQLAGRDLDWRLGVWTAMVALPIGFGILLIRSGVRAGLLRRLRAALVVSLAVPLLQFWYTTEYLPGTTMGLDMHVQVEKGQVISAENGNSALFPVRATVSAKNATRVKQRVVGSTIELFAIDVHPRNLPPDDARFVDELGSAAAERTRAAFTNMANMFATYNSPKFVAAAPFFIHQNYFLEPGDGLSQTIVFHVPQDIHALLRLRTAIVTVNGNRLQMGFSPIHKARVDVQQGKKAVLETWRVHETSLLSKITRRSRYLHANYIYDPVRNRPITRVYVDQIGKNSDHVRTEFTARMAAVYGLTFSIHYAEFTPDGVQQSQSTAPQRG